MIAMGREDTNIGLAHDQEENQETDQGLALAPVNGRGILIVLNVTFSCFLWIISFKYYGYCEDAFIL